MITSTLGLADEEAMTRSQKKGRAGRVPLELIGRLHVNKIWATSLVAGFVPAGREIKSKQVFPGPKLTAFDACFDRSEYVGASASLSI